MMLPLRAQAFDQYSTGSERRKVRIISTMSYMRRHSTKILFGFGFGILYNLE